MNLRPLRPKQPDRNRNFLLRNDLRNHRDVILYSLHQKRSLRIPGQSIRAACRAIKLTGQSGRDGRSGRWRKKYRGKIYYFDGSRGKSDRSAYDAIIKHWELEKLKIDSSTPRPHEEELTHEIEVWEQVLAWSKRHGDYDMAQTAFDKCTRLRALLDDPILENFRER